MGQVDNCSTTILSVACVLPNYCPMTLVISVFDLVAHDLNEISNTQSRQFSAIFNYNFVDFKILQSPILYCHEFVNHFVKTMIDLYNKQLENANFCLSHNST